MNYQGGNFYGEMNRIDRMPRALNSRLPAVVVAPPPGNSNITPQSLMERLPTIIDRTPVVIAPPMSLGTWINQNPLIAVAAVIAGLLFIKQAGR